MAGRELSGAAGKEREAKAQKEDEAKQIELDNRPYTAVPVNRLCNVKLHNLHKVLERLEGAIYSLTHSPQLSSTMPLYTLTITLSHTLTITCTCCCDGIYGAQDRKISHAHSLILSL